MTIILASNNKNKLKEIKEILSPLGYNVVSQSEAGITIDVLETGSTFEENASLKANEIYKLSKCAVIADDSGLEVDALNKAPGVFSHRFAGPDATDDDRCNKILSELKNVKQEDRTARFVCAICYISENGEEKIVRGVCEGSIGYEKKGNNGFGYDPIFMVGNKSFAEMTSEEKNKISHRSDALDKLYKILKMR